MQENIKAATRRTWETETSIEGLQLGCMLRIADATEAMAKNHVKLQNDYDWVKGRMNYHRRACESERRSNAALRGVITKLKKKLAEQEGITHAR